MSSFREKISKILVKWNMPTRQAAIIELESLFKEEFKRLVQEASQMIIPTCNDGLCNCGEDVLNAYEQSLGKKIEEGEKHDIK